MKDILFTVKQQKMEIIYVAVSLILAISVNIYAIISYGTEWKELYSQWFTMLVLAVFFYFVIALFRFLYWLISRLISKNRKN